MSGLTPNYSWQYPTGSDAPPDVADDMQTLATQIDASLFAFTNGQASLSVGVPAYTGASNAISSVCTAGTIASATPANIPAATSSFSFTKKFAATNLLVSFHMTTYSTAIDTTLGLGVLIGVTDYTVTQFRHSSATLYRQASGTRIISGIAAGAITVQARWFRVTGAGTLTTENGIAYFSLSCLEAP